MGRLPRQSETAPVSGAVRNCRTEKTEPITPERQRSQPPHLSLSPRGPRAEVAPTQWALGEQTVLGIKVWKQGPRTDRSEGGGI